MERRGGCGMSRLVCEARGVGSRELALKVLLLFPEDEAPFCPLDACSLRLGAEWELGNFGTAANLGVAAVLAAE